MKIIFATDIYLPTPGGISIVVQRISSALAKKGHTVGVIAPSPHWKFESEIVDGVTIYGIQSLAVHKKKQLFYSPAFLFEKNIRNIITEFKPDIIHLETPQDIAATALKIGRKLKLPVLATCHIMPENIAAVLPFLPSNFSKLAGNLYMKQIIKTFDYVDLITSPTPFGVEILKSLKLKPPAIALSNGIDLAKFKRPPAEEIKKIRAKYKFPDALAILYIGRLDHEKKVDILLQSLQYLDKSLPFHLILEGKGQLLDFFQNMIIDMGLKDKVSFLGYVDENELPALYALAEVFVMPSTAELQSLVTMEAMAVGLPVIGADAGALPYLIKSNINGFLFKPDDPADLADKIQKILINPQLQKDMASESLKIIKEHDICSIITKLEKIYQNLISSK